MDRYSFFNNSNSRPNAESSKIEYSRNNLRSNSSGLSRGLSKIDPRICADVQSQGLTSRIVKYHENGSRLNRSMSLNNLYGKSSNLTIQHASPQKPIELPYKASRQNVSMTRILPPEKSSFRGLTLSGLLRSSSVLTMPQSNDSLSSENRPIIHPPSTEKDIQPTRSVLEVLKEISRKRISNQVLSGDADENDTSKKICASSADHNTGSIYRNIPMQLPVNFKRQRENVDDNFVYDQPNLSYLNSNLSQINNHVSPEQKKVKLRHCNYNNDVSSSLSSSKRNSNKRKLFEQDSIQHQEKLLRYQPETRASETSYAKTTVPSTPQSPCNEIVTQKSIETTKSDTSSQLSQSSQVTIVEKRKLTLFNKEYDPKTTNHAEKKLDEDDDGNICAGIQFIKPKKSTSAIGNASNLAIQRTQKSKLALMLCGLRGEIYLGDDEDQSNRKSVESTSLATNISRIEPNNKIVPPPVTPQTSSASNIVLATNNNVAENTPTSAPQTQPTKIISPLTGIKLTHKSTTDSPTTSTTKTDTPSTTNAAPTVSESSNTSVSTNISLTSTTKQVTLPNLLSNGNSVSFLPTQDAQKKLLPTFNNNKEKSVIINTSTASTEKVSPPTNTFSLLPTVSTSGASPVTNLGNATTFGANLINFSPKVTNSDSSTAAAPATMNTFGFNAPKAANNLNTFAPKVTETVASSAPVSTTMNTFSFTAPKTSTSLNTFGTNLAGTVSSTSAVGSMNTFNFTAPKTTTNLTTFGTNATATVSSTPVSSSTNVFSFGVPKTGASFNAFGTNVSETVSSSSAAAPLNTFSFTAPKTTSLNTFGANVTETVSSTPATASLNTFSFTAPKVATTYSGFSFDTKNTVSTGFAMKPTNTFNFTNQNPTSANSTAGFSFGNISAIPSPNNSTTQPQQQNTNILQSGGFTMNAKPNPVPTIDKNANNAGTAAESKTSNNLFNFKAPTNGFNFSAAADTNKSNNLFSFGNTNVAQTTLATTVNNGNNIPTDNKMANTSTTFPNTFLTNTAPTSPFTFGTQKVDAPTNLNPVNTQTGGFVFGNNLNGANKTSGNIFAAQSSPVAPHSISVAAADRKIRRATRRLTKS